MKKILTVILFLAQIAATAQTISINENFASNPAAQGWQSYGDTNLFQWDSTNHNLAVTWDSSQPNSYYYHPVGTFLTESDGFTLAFDLTLRDAMITNNTFELAVGLLNFSDATAPGFLRGTGYTATNVVEFDYFMDPMFGNSVAATELDSSGNIADLYDLFADTSFQTNTTYHISISHARGDQLISSEITAGGEVFTSFPDIYVQPGFDDFRVDTLSITSYSDTDAYGDARILAHGTISNLVFTTTAQPVGAIKAGFVGPVWQAQFVSRTNWVYTLERSSNLQSWTNASPATAGRDDILILQDTSPPAGGALYRVHAHQ
jgi:hypothetical protein